MTTMRSVAYAAITAVGVGLAVAAHGPATEWRGYEAIGGEALIALLPLWALVTETVVRDVMGGGAR